MFRLYKPRQACWTSLQVTVGPRGRHLSYAADDAHRPQLCGFSAAAHIAAAAFAARGQTGGRTDGHGTVLVRLLSDKLTA